MHAGDCDAVQSIWAKMLRWHLLRGSMWERWPPRTPLSAGCERMSDWQSRMTNSLKRVRGGEGTGGGKEGGPDEGTRSQL
jgi:hypothetical protein